MDTEITSKISIYALHEESDHVTGAKAWSAV